MIIKKLDAAYKQLNTAILLFFQDCDPISVHTLAGAAIEIYNNHIKDKRVVFNNNLIFHYDNRFVIENKRKDFHKALTKYRNYFKHADNDANSEIDFNKDVNDFIIMDAVRAYEVVTGEKNAEKPILCIFILWFILNHEDLIDAEYMKSIKEQAYINSILTGYKITSKADCYELVQYLYKNKIESFEKFAGKI